MKNMSSYLQALLCALISAGLALAGKSLIATIPPILLLFLRLSIACICFLPFIHVRNFTTLNRSDKLMLVLAGVIGVFAGNLLFYQGLGHSTAFNAALINALTPILTLIGMCMYLRQLPTPMALLSFFVALCGVILVITNGNFNLHEFVYANGNVILLFATMTSVVYSIAAKHKTDALSSSAFAFGSFLISVLLLTPLTAHSGLFALIPAITWTQWLMILYLATAGSTLGFYLFTQSVVKIGPDMTAYIVYSMAPLFVLLIDYAVYHKPVSIWQLSGTALILLSLGLQLTRLSLEETPHTERHR